MPRERVLITGCSGGGKSSLLSELRSRGYIAVEEPGRRIVKEQMANGGAALPWIDIEAFGRRAFDLAQTDLVEVRDSAELIFFDRGLIDAAIAISGATGIAVADLLANHSRYHDLVFLAPPWREIYRRDAERQHGFDSAIREYEDLEKQLPQLDYQTLLLPKTSLSDRADFVIHSLKAFSSV